MMQRIQCLFCRHFNLSNSTCPAFPKGIPIEILAGEVPHLNPVHGQEGQWVFEQLSEEAFDRKARYFVSKVRERRSRAKK